MSLQSEVTASLAELESVNNHTFSWDGNNWRCHASSFSTTKTMDIGGFPVEFDLSLTVRRSLFQASARPVPRQLIQFQGKSFRIQRVLEEASGAFLQIFCISATK